MRAFLTIAALSAGLLGAGQAQAQDAAAGERVFNRCRACHVLEAGVNRVGPSLYGVVGRQAGIAEGFNGYSESMIQAGEQGLVWTPDQMVAYLEDPSTFLQETLGDPSARGKMAYKLADETDRADVVAYIEQAGQ